MLNIYVDADSCPVKDEITRIALRHQLEVFMVSNNWLKPISNIKFHNITVSKDFDAADDWIFEHANYNDIVITSDIILANRVIQKDAKVIFPTGKLGTKDNIGMMLAMRNLNTHLRETGVIAGYNASFNKQNRSDFLQNMEELIQQLKRKKSY
ncbi:MAG: YaiI/YqxD family protein [Alphaproteobacteria bacterium]